MTNEKYDTKLIKINKRILEIDNTIKRISDELYMEIDIENNSILIEDLERELTALSKLVDNTLDDVIVDEFLESVDQLLIDEGYLTQNKERIHNNKL